MHFSPFNPIKDLTFASRTIKKGFKKINFSLNLISSESQKKILKTHFEFLQLKINENNLNDEENLQVMCFRYFRCSEKEIDILKISFLNYAMRIKIL